MEGNQFEIRFNNRESTEEKSIQEEDQNTKSVSDDVPKELIDDLYSGNDNAEMYKK